MVQEIECVNSDIIVGGSSLENRIHVVIKEVLRVSENKPEQAKAICDALASIDWQAHIQQIEHQEEERKQRIQHTLENGGGYCENCHHFAERLYLFDWEKSSLKNISPERLCYRCYFNYQRRYHLEWSECLFPCDDCHTMTHGPSLTRNHPVIKSHGWGYCPSCFQKHVQEQTITCSLCGTITIDHVYGEICRECCIKYPQPINAPQQSVVNAQLERARKAGTPATLTLAQWLLTLNYFEGKCAYCQRHPYEALEHFIPISLQGGTTANNCVPACTSCNARKATKLSETLEREHIFPSENLARIRSYLASIP